MFKEHFIVYWTFCVIYPHNSYIRIPVSDISLLPRTKFIDNFFSYYFYFIFNFWKWIRSLLIAVCRFQPQIPVMAVDESRNNAEWRTIHHSYRIGSSQSDDNTPNIGANPPETEYALQGVPNKNISGIHKSISNFIPQKFFNNNGVRFQLNCV